MFEACAMVREKRGGEGRDDDKREREKESLLQMLKTSVRRNAKRNTTVTFFYVTL